MDENEFNFVDYLGEARSRVTDQFKDQPVFDRYLQLLLKGEQDLQQVFDDLMTKRSIDTAEGVNLDIIGDIVGQPRTQINIALYNFFGFQGVAQSGGFGDLTDTSKGNIFYSYGDPTSGNALLDDPSYRLYIKSKITRNITSVTPEEFIQFVKFILNAPVVYINEEQAKVRVSIGRALTNQEKALIKSSNADGTRLIPKPVGVSIEYVDFTNNFFAFQGVPNANGFGDINNPSVGGQFAEIF